MASETNSAEEILRHLKQRDRGKAKNGCLIAVGFIVVLAVLSQLISKNDDTPKKVKSSEELRGEEISKLFSAWDGSLPSLERVIKDSMNDPDSYEHVGTVYSDHGDYLVVKTTFRGKNKFGGVVKNWVRAKVDLKGAIIEVIDQGE